MPEWVCESPRNVPRAAAIAAEILAQDFDILCFEKAFDPAARAVLAGALSARYPFQYGPANAWRSIDETSGVWVLSRSLLVNYAEIEYRACANVECFSRKGAMLLTGVCEGHVYHLIATHLQGEEGAYYTDAHQRIRDRQMDQLGTELLAPNLAPGVPVIVCGDFATPRHDPTDPTKESEGYQHMLRTLGVTNSVDTRITYDDDLRDNDLAKSNTKVKSELDYVLVRANGWPLDVERQRHVFRRSGWDAPTNRRDLSYRYAVGAEITFRS
jgi:endonuclease/exonuclease/phosphatase family metal-dependent hydrolase